MTPPTVLWFRRDLRLADHAALQAAGADAGAGADVLGVFVADDALLGPSGAPRRAFLAGCLTRLSESMDGKLLIVKGRPAAVLPAIAAAVGARAVHISADFMPYGRRRDELVAESLRAMEIELIATGSPYAVAPGRVRKPDGSRYAVFTPYFRGWTEHGWRAPASRHRGRRQLGRSRRSRRDRWPSDDARGPRNRRSGRLGAPRARREGRG